MNSYFINYRFNEICLNQLKDEYKTKFNYDKNKSFLYTNLIEISKFYEFNSYKFKSSIYFNFINDPFKLLYKLIDEIRQSSYSSEGIFLLYSLASYYVIKNSGYFNELTLKNDLNYFSKKSYYKYFSKSHRYNLEILDILDKVVSSTYNILMIRPYLSDSLKKFYFYSNHKFIFKIRYLNKFIFSKKIKGLNIKNVSIKKIDSSEIDENLSIMINEFNLLATALNEALYLNNYKKLDSFKMEH